eukprot:CAMPEP_0179465426 /NCGR_PEP_ID=MMETSP0799-20121207/46982_1 /TAXON_ID=46947 /ORGANISM="Geminigera cryophila, Strain CCMP2564" /LENGTH=78 /DNA_ID=CAMNT_0021269677 /DNA_START=211 /DNA_END=443 /DNA_ORIENTATION=+
MSRASAVKPPPYILSLQDHQRQTSNTKDQSPHHVLNPLIGPTEVEKPSPLLAAWRKDKPPPSSMREEDTAQAFRKYLG